VGGENESVLKTDAGKASAESVLKADQPAPSVLSAYGQVLRQTAEIRQHVSNGEVHFHDDQRKLKAAIPVADWFGVRRQLRTNQPFTWIDAKFNTIVCFTPLIRSNPGNPVPVVEVIVQIEPIELGERFKQLDSLAGK